MNETEVKRQIAVEVGAIAAAHYRLAQQTEAKITALQTAVAYHSTQAAALGILIKQMVAVTASGAGRTATDTAGAP